MRESRRRDATIRENGMRTMAHDNRARLPSPLMELSALDLTIIVAFFVVSLGIGLWYRGKASESFVEYFAEAFGQDPDIAQMLTAQS